MVMLKMTLLASDNSSNSSFSSGEPNCRSSLLSTSCLHSRWPPPGACFITTWSTAVNNRIIPSCLSRKSLLQCKQKMHQQHTLQHHPECVTTCIHTASPNPTCTHAHTHHTASPNPTCTHTPHSQPYPNMHTHTTQPALTQHAHTHHTASSNPTCTHTPHSQP